MNLLIVGAGGHGNCCAEIAERMCVFEKISFLDDKYDSENNDNIVGKIQDLSKLRKEYDCVFVAIGNNELRKDIYNSAKTLGYKMVNLIDPTAFISKSARLGEAIVVFPNAVLEPNCSVLNGTIISSNTTINHDSTVGEFVLIYSNSVIRPKACVGHLCKIESGCVISFGTIVTPSSHILEGSVVNC